MFAPWQAALLWLLPLPDTVQEQVNNAIDYDLDGIIVYVDKSGEAPGLYTAGWKDRAAKVPADPQALFKIGSISKLYLAAATAKLVNEQRLALNDTLAQHFPELVGKIEHADKITLKMMLQHRSGIANYTDQDQFDWGNPPNNSNKSLEMIFDKPADFAPGTDYNYSNTNYLLIGNILDKVLGYGHQQYIKSDILNPLGLQHTYGLLSQTNLADVASGYYTGYEGDLKEVSFISPAGSMVASAQDVGIFLRALNKEVLLNTDEQAIYSSIYEYEHDGWVLGYHSVARYYQDIDAVVVQFVNTTGDNTLSTSLMVHNRIVKILRK
jgi:CubicO group peptidase (beta-lactamase class C family)